MNARAPIINPEMLLLLEKELDKYPTMNGYLESSGMTSGSMLSTRGIEATTIAVLTDLSMTAECFTFLDTLDFLCMFYCESPDVLTTRMVQSFVNSRILQKPELCGMTSAVSGYTVNAKEANDLIELLANNRPILALVIFSIIKRFFFK